MKRTLTLTSVLLLLTLLLFSATAMAAPIKLRVGHDLPPFTTPGVGIAAWAKEVNEKAAGRIVVEVYPASTLAEQKGGVEMLQAGVADCYMVGLGSHRKIFPISEVVSLQGLGFPDTAKGHKAHADTFLGLIDKYPRFQKEFKDYKIVFDIINANSVLLSKDKEIHLPTDLAGLKIGATGRSGIFVKNMGGASVFSVPPQAYQKLQTGVLDAQPIHFLAIGEFKLFEVAKCAFDLTWGQGQIPLLMSKRTWDRLSDADRKVIMDAAVIGKKVSFDLVEERTKKGRRAFLDAGGTIVTPTPEEKAAWMKEFKQLWELWATGVEKKGVKSARAIMADWQQAVENYKE